MYEILFCCCNNALVVLFLLLVVLVAVVTATEGNFRFKSNVKVIQKSITLRCHNSNWGFNYPLICSLICSLWRGSFLFAKICSLK